jgi:hypothetical protein
MLPARPRRTRKPLAVRGLVLSWPGMRHLPLAYPTGLTDAVGLDPVVDGRPIHRHSDEQHEIRCDITSDRILTWTGKKFRLSRPPTSRPGERG